MCQIAATRADRHIFPYVISAIVSLLLLLTGIWPVHAQHIAGIDAPEFRRALALWLDGDDENSIPVFAALAQDNNTASQVLLSLVDKTAALQGPMIVLLPRAERSALLRAPGGFSGRNWMNIAAQNNLYAKHWVSLWQMENGIAVAKGFAAMDEPRATRNALLMTVNRQGAGFEPHLLAEEWYPQSLRHLTRSRTLSSEEAADLHPGHPLRKSTGLSLEDSDLRDWLQSSPLALHLRAACDMNCRPTRADCMLALYHALNSYYALLVIGSPSATLIPEQTFAYSARGSHAVARHIMVRHSARTRDIMLRNLASIDECTVAWLQDEFRRYMPVARTSPSAND